MKYRALLIAEAANPEQVSVPLVGWSHAEALSRVADTHLVTQVRNQAAVERFGWTEGKEFSVIDSELVARTAFKLGNLMRGGKGKGWTTVAALKAPAYLYFERLLWKQFREPLKAGRYDIVHRITPLSPTTPSFLASKCRKLGIPHIIGPMNGGVAWPQQFDSARRAEKEWLSYVRGAYRLLPGQGAIRRGASAIICGSTATYAEYKKDCESQLVYMPENAVDPNRFPGLLDSGLASRADGPLRVAFLGRMVPYKGADMLLEAAAGLIKQGKIIVDLIGDGPQRLKLEQLAEDLGIKDGVEFSGWLEHEEVHKRLARAHVLGFPSIREFGGGVVLEAMALGLVPVVVQYGGPTELVTDRSGILVPLGSRQEITLGVRDALERLASAPDLVQRLSGAARERVRRHFTWDQKAKHTLQVYDWVLGNGSKPDYGMPFRDE